MKKASLFTLVLWVCLTSLIFSESQAASLFDGVELSDEYGIYMVTKTNVNVRAAPASTGKVLTKLEKRDIVESPGYAKDTQWLAIRQNGSDLGFVYAQSLTPLIDASFDKPLVGRIDLSEQKKPECSYEVSYEGRSVEEEIVFVSTDYLAHFKCRMGFDIFTFNSMLFMSEVPVDLGLKPVFQITINLPDIATGYEEFLSSTALYDQKKQLVSMDNVSLKTFKENDISKTLEAKTAKQAIEQALKLQLASFNEKAWRTIAGKIPSPADVKPN